NTVIHKGNLLEQIETGEGKSMIMAMLAANLWFEGGAVNICTSNPELALVGFEEFSPMFDLLGIPRNQKLLSSQTPVSEYCYDCINYTDTAQLSLFIAKQKLDPYYIKHHKNTKISLASDEADFTLFDDNKHYRYAIPLHPVDLHWVFPLLYDFIVSEDFTNEQATIGKDIENARERLITASKLYSTEVQQYVEKLSKKQIDIWIESALAARQLR